MKINSKYWKIITSALLAMAAVFAVIHYNIPSLFGSKTSIKKFEDTSDGSLRGYLNQAQNLAPRGANATTSATFLAVGDIMLSRNVAAAIQKSGDVDLPFQKMSDILRSTDFNFGNLESPFTDRNHQIIGGHSLIFGAPQENVDSLSQNNFKILNLANNHSFDQGLFGLDLTKKVLDQNGIVHTGTGDNLDEAWTPATITANGIKICFIGASYASANDSGKTANSYVARIEDLPNLKSVILNLKSTCDFIIASMHAGTEYTRAPNKAQTTFAHAAIDAGADIVIGAHPHWIQTTEQYKGKYIFYSLGNFIFDQNFSQETKEGLTLKIALSKNGACPPSPPLGEKSEIVMPDLGRAKPDQQSGKLMSSGGQRGCADDLQGSRIPAKLDSIKLLPVIIENSQPRPATANEAKKILGKINLSTFAFYP